jgi:chromosome segregation ATPase
MTDSDLTLKVLVEMRDELRGTNQRLDVIERHAARSNQRLEVIEQQTSQTNQRLEVIEQHTSQMNQRLEVIEHTMVDFGTQVVLLGRYMKNSVTRHDGDVERHDEEIADLRTRVEKLEAKS